MQIQAEQSASAKIEIASKSSRETLGSWNWKEVKNKQARIWDSKGKVPKTVAKSGEELPSLPLELSSTLTAIPRALCTAGYKGYSWLSTVWKQPKAGSPSNLSSVCKDELCSADLHSLCCIICFTVSLQPFVWASLSPVANRNRPTVEYSVCISFSLTFSPSPLSIILRT